MTPQERQALFPEGQVVRVRDATEWTADIAAKVRDRLGEVTGHTGFSGDPIVTFRAVGRRKAFQKRFSSPDRTLVKVLDIETIAAWREEVARTAERANALQVKKQAITRKSKG